MGVPVGRLNGLEFHELAALVYRDNVRLKHMDQVRLQKELSLLNKSEESTRKQRQKSFQQKQSPADVMAELIIEHLITVPGKK